MNAGHTPGPWEAFKGIEENDELRCGVSAMRGKTGYLIATIENGAPGDCCDTELANALLMSAAPEMVHALKLALEYWEHRQQRYKNRYPIWVQQARAAIAKAEGR